MTATFCEASRYFQPANGARIDAVRQAIDRHYAGSDLWPILLTSLLEAADRVDSTTGLQMAYLKQWAARSAQPLVLRVPELIGGPGRAVKGDACVLVGSGQLDPVDLAYIDPPYNQHRYDANYHVWETIVAWDNPPSTAWPASARTCGTRPPRAPSTVAAPCPTPCAGWWPGWPPMWSSSPTTTRRG